MPCIDFRKKERLFNREVVKDMNDIYQDICASRSITEKQLKDLLVKLEIGRNQIKAQKIYSQFLQHLIYFSYHNNQDKAYVKQLVKWLIEQPEFYYSSEEKDNKPIVIIWIDPKEGYSNLHSLSKNGDIANLTLLLKKLDALFESKENNFYEKYFSHLDEYGFSSLNAACNEGHFEIIILLLEKAKAIFSDDIEGLKAYFSNLNKDGFSSLNSASKEGHIDIVELLLAEAKEIFADDKEGLKTFISSKDKDGFSSLNAACATGYVESVELLLTEAKAVFADDRESLKTFISDKNKDGFSSLTSACFEGNIVIVELLLAEAKEIFADDREGLKAYFSNLTKDGFSSLNSAGKQGHIDIVELLLAEAKKISAGDREGLKAYFSNLTKDGFSSLNSASKQGRIDIVELLLAEAKEIFADDREGLKAYISNKETYGFSSFNTACREGHLEIVQLLMKEAKKIFSPHEFHEFLESKNRYGFTPLNAVSKELKDKTNQRKSDAETERKYGAIMQILINEGASIDEPNNKNFSSLDNSLPGSMLRDYAVSSSDRNKDGETKEHSDNKKSKKRPMSHREQKDVDVKKLCHPTKDHNKFFKRTRECYTPMKTHYYKKRAI